jgi:hypothetical protein
MCKKKKVSKGTYFTLDEEFRVDMDALEESLYTLESEEWNKVKNILIQMEGIKMKYIGEYDYGNAI